MMQILPASSDREIAAARLLFEEYAAWLGVDLEFQGFAGEVASLPGPYAPPHGRLLLAWEGGEVAGCVALRRFGGTACEIKRLYVRPSFRGLGIGRRLAETIIADAQQIGYASMLLDTLPQMDAATGLYDSLGFVRRRAYYDTPLRDTIFMELQL